MIIEQFVLKNSDYQSRDFATFLLDMCLSFEVTFVLDMTVFKVTGSQGELAVAAHRHSELRNL